MDNKIFTIIIVILLLTFGFRFAVKAYEPNDPGKVSIEEMPLQKGDWVGEQEIMPGYVTDMLNPEQVFTAAYTNSRNRKVHLLVAYYSSKGGFGGPHSPRNCMPGSGWNMERIIDNPIKHDGKTIPASRFYLRQGEYRQVMDFWYATRYGETASDYVFKLYSMLSSLSFQPRDVAFIRLITPDTPEDLAALKDFERLYIPEIYNRIPFE